MQSDRNSVQIVVEQVAGTVRPSPLLAEIRSTTLVLTRCLGGVQMNPGPAARNPVKVRAGQKSWAARVGRESLKEKA
jgi:hypothetical protein